MNALFSCPKNTKHVLFGASSIQQVAKEEGSSRLMIINQFYYSNVVRLWSAVVHPPCSDYSTGEEKIGGPSPEHRPKSAVHKFHPFRRSPRFGQSVIKFDKHKSIRERFPSEFREEFGDQRKRMFYRE